MSDTIIAGIFTLSGTTLGALIGFLASYERKKIKEAKSDIELLGNQVKSYWLLEKNIVMKFQI